MLGRDVLVLETLGLPLRPLERGAQTLTEVLPAPAAHLGHPRQLALELARQGVQPHAELAQDRAHDALTLLEQRGQQVLRLDRLVLVPVRQRLRGLDRLLSLDRELVQSHRRLPLRVPAAR
jgi:hypothetical protein